jgi:DNA-binding transcriptional MocR family regulator
MIEFGWGHPDQRLLPVEGLRRAADEALQQAGPAALAYGAEQGPGRLIEPLCARIGRIEGATPEPAQILITGGVSQALDLLCTLLARPGDVALVEAPVYHLALRILRDHALELVPVDADAAGLRPDALEQALAWVQRAGKRAPLLYCVPTFTNPTGRSLQVDRRPALVEIAARHGVLVLEDDVYRELWYDAPPPPPLVSYAPPGTVARLGSFSKILAPGLRLGWLQADAALVRRCMQGGLLDSGGGVNHFTAHVVAEYLRMELLDTHVASLRIAYRARRNALLEALTRYLPASCTFEAPGGGFFAWVRLPGHVDATALLPRAEAAGVSFLPGARFHSNGAGANYMRLAFSLLPVEEMEVGACELGRVLSAL